ncbi:MAG: type II secretion system protein [Thermotogae bacterium]|nr:type II secretion system protein [Thermotogota bacterium]
MLKRVHRVDEGFTLVELLVVIAVIAALLTSITPIAINAVSKSRTTRVAMSLKTLANGVTTYFITDGPSLPDASLSNLASAVTLERVKERYFISGDISDYSIKWMDGDLTDGEARYCIVYHGGDLDSEEAERFFYELDWWSDLEGNCTAEPDATHNAPAYCGRVERFW